MNKLGFRITCDVLFDYELDFLSNHTIGVDTTEYCWHLKETSAVLDEYNIKSLLSEICDTQSSFSIYAIQTGDDGNTITTLSNCKIDQLDTLHAEGYLLRFNVILKDVQFKTENKRK